MEELIDAQMKNESASIDVSDLFKSAYVKPIVLVASLMIFQQLSGISAAVFNAEAIFKASSHSNGTSDGAIDARLGAVILNATQVLYCIHIV